MELYLKNQIELCENSNLHIESEFYKNVLLQFNKNSINNFKKLLDYNISNSNGYFIDMLLNIKNQLC